MKKIMFFMMIASFVCAITVKSQTTTGTNVLVTYTSVHEFSTMVKATQTMLTTKANEMTYNGPLTAIGDSILQIVLVKNIPVSRGPKKCNVDQAWVQMIDNGRISNYLYNLDKMLVITRLPNGKLNAEGGNGDDDEYED